MKSNLHSLFVFCLVVMIPLRMVSQATCPVPTNPTTTNIGNHNATLSWTAPAGTVASVVQYRPVTTPESQWINVTSQTSSFTLTNLACGTNYQWHVASICTNGTTVPGTYSPVVGFATTACNTACVAPTNPHAININPTGATLSWTPVTGALSYIVQYRLIISAGAAWTTVNTQNASLTLTNLICGAAYEWHVATVCGTAAGNISPYSATVDFVTAACTTNCPAPTGLTSSISGAATVLIWTGTTSALAYIIQYRPVTNPESAWINITTQNPATSFTLTNLLCGKVYQWHVKAICNTSSNNGTSPYSAMAYFTTAACAPPTCIAPSAPATTNITGSGATLSWNAPAGAIS